MAELFRRQDYKELLATVAEAQAGTDTERAVTPAGLAFTTNNVKYYGAIGDGVHDDTAAIQAAITIIGATTGGTIYFPAGEYLVSITLSMQNLRSIKWQGIASSNQYAPSSKLRWTGAAGGTLLNMNGTDNCVLEDIGFFGDNAAAQTNNTQVGISALGNPTYLASAYIHLIRCYFQNFGICVNLGLNTDSVDPWFFDNCNFWYGSTSTGVKINSSNCTRIVFNSCTFNSTPTGTTSKGIHCVNGGFRLFNCLTQGNKYGIYHEAATVPSEILNHHSELEGTGYYSPIAGNHHKYWPIKISGYFNYNSTDYLFYFGNSLFQYYVDSVISMATPTQDDIIVSVGCEEVWLWNLTWNGAIKDTGGATVTVNGWYGFQTAKRNVHFLDKVLATTGLGVGNSAAATTLGSVVKKIEIFDATGNSLGYLPVYNSIT